MSTLRVTTLQNLSGVEVYTAKAWVNFNGTGTVAIRAQGNVSSITDNGSGDYTVNFTNALADANYAFLGTAQGQGLNGTTSITVEQYVSAAPTASAVRFFTKQSSAVLDVSYVFIGVIR